MEVPYETLLLEISDQVATIRLNAIESMNAMSYQLRTDLIDSLDKASEADNASVIVITGTGRAFCVGGDVKELPHLKDEDAARALYLHGSNIAMKIRTMEKPVIAAVNGAAVGAGFSLAINCDLVIASEEAMFSLAFLRVGLVPDLGATFFFPRLIGLQKAKELAFTGRKLSAREMAELGAVNAIVTAENLEHHTRELAMRIAKTPPGALGMTKKLLNQSFDSTIEEMISMEQEAQVACLMSKEHKELTSALTQKTK